MFTVSDCPKRTAFGFSFVTMLGGRPSLLIGCGFRRPHCLSRCLASRATLWRTMQGGRGTLPVTRGRTACALQRGGRPTWILHMRVVLQVVRVVV